MLDNYTSHLRQQSVLATLPFERWSEVIQEAINWGLLSTDTKISRFLRLQPIFPYFLRNRLYAPEQREMRNAVETAFSEYYDQLGGMLYQLFNSNDPQERQVGQIITSLEYENLTTALNLALVAKVSIHNPYFALSRYLDTSKDQNRGLQLGQNVLNSFETYPKDKLEGQLGLEFAHAIGDIANRQLELKDYNAAKASYQKSLDLVTQLKYVDKKEQASLEGRNYHGLGYVAKEQRQSKQAREYFLQALEIFVEYKDTSSSDVVIQSLASLWKASGEANIPVTVATMLGFSVEETEKLLREMLGEH
jgi:tetratricopeptide (TPR) repeat protein